MTKRPYPKRFLDLALAVPALVALSPLLLILYIWVRVSLGKPALFRQKRPGKNGEPFVLIKFRSMTDAVDSDGMPLSDAERLTRFGRALRASSLDELPELWNVIRGDMSLVGPRPLLMHYLEHYTSEQARRHEVRPGITGWSQVKGRNELPWTEKLALDTWYVDNYSLALDLKILALTVRQVIVRQGISAEGSATSPMFAEPRIDRDQHQAK